MADEKVMLGHGSGGSMMKRIIDEVFFAAYGSDELLVGDDAAVLPALEPGERLAYSTDSFVVTPHFFPGGDIGRLVRHGERCGHLGRPAPVPVLRLHSGRGLSHGRSAPHLRLYGGLRQGSRRAHCDR